MTSGSSRTLRPAAGSRVRDMAPPLPAALSWGVLVAFAFALAAASAMARVPVWTPLVYVVMSAIGFIAYGLDKAAAGANRRRTPERVLLALGLCCAWPGAIVAQQLLRHKTRKRSFRRRFWLTVAVNTAALVGLVLVAAALA